MSSTPKLSPRLQAIVCLLQQRAIGIDHVWDGCCDHGYLGMHILEQQLCGHLYFVDQLAHITEPLAAHLAGFGYENYSVLTQDCAQLSLCRPGSRLVIIAGVGGRALVEMLRSLQRRHSGEALEFIVCAANCVYDLREYLGGENYRLLSEQIVSDRGREYELMQLTLNIDGGERVSAVGQMWQRDNVRHHHYQQQLLAHYRRQQMNSDGDRLRDIIAAYACCL